MPARNSQTRTKRSAPKRPGAGTRVLRGATDRANPADMTFNTPLAPSMRPAVRHTPARFTAPARKTAGSPKASRGFGAIGLMTALALSLAAGLGAGSAVQDAIAKTKAPEILVEAPIQAQNAAFTF